MFPLFLNLKQRLCVVIGGGPVGRRKAHALLEGGASVRLMCLEPRPADEVDPALEWVTAAYQSRHLDGATLVVAAATEEINRCVVTDARARGVWVNAATEPDSGDFFMPAVVRRGELTIAVGTQGSAPGLAREVRLLLEDQLDEAFLHWVALLAELRPWIRLALTDAQQRREALRCLCQAQWLERLRGEDPGQVRAAMLQAIGMFDSPLAPEGGGAEDEGGA